MERQKEAWQDRVVVEKELLTIKIDRLTKFIEGERFKKLNYRNKRLLDRQRRIMELYLDVLVERIEEF